jgi:hypothetical protein
VSAETNRRICWTVVVASMASIAVLITDSAIRLSSTRALPNALALLALWTGAFLPQVAFALVLAGGTHGVVRLWSRREDDGWMLSLSLAILACTLPALPPEGRLGSGILALAFMLSALLLLISRARQIRRAAPGSLDVDRRTSEPPD